MLPETVPGLVDQLHRLGFYLWHNRGRLFVGPMSKLQPEQQAALAAHKAEIIGYLKRFPLQPEEPYNLVAPCPPDEGSYAGRLVRRPWDYEVAVVLPTLGSLDLLQAAVACWRHQTVSPYLVVIDTGTAPELLCAMEAMRSYDLELHSIAGHGWRHSSSPVSAALDLAFAVCQQRHALLTHIDVFPKSYTVLEELLSRCSPSRPVVGYQMSRRFGSQEWTRCWSHTLTLVDLQVMRRERVTWNLLTALEADDEVEDRYLGWPDTETQFGRACRASGIAPEFLGPESNHHVAETPLLVHWRSAPSVRHYLPDQVKDRHAGLSAWLERTRDLGVAAPLQGTEGPGPRKEGACGFVASAPAGGAGAGGDVDHGHRER